MSLEIVRRVDQQNPQLLRTNIGSTCHLFTLYVIDALRASGLGADLVAKTAGEGQYVPPGFQRRAVTGLDGKEYICTGVSHDAIWCDGQIIDTIASANDGPDPIFAANTWDQLKGQPVWNPVPREHWRPNNPPLKNGAPVPPASTAPTPAPTYPTYEALGGDEGAKQITRQLEADYKRAGRPGLDGDCGGWLRRVDYDVLTGKVPTVEAGIARHRKEWCDALGIPVAP